ncbi:type VI secretion system-associated lipoprotein [Burkholderia sp. AU16741]|uniref:type VI secretion system lipoprotein TssJ n=1 Tax=unclassified Burkholderia TaxID=2613784 RepID=UPI000B79E0D5|nr:MULTISPECIES: type VI secretion system lipoprotein TssJ [unclassified Burkholderia]MDN7427520.1 type VI secretion system lipoprotein TssJ [Burkholderia sp. AU45388]OXI30364.1 type VI secretion system-associated lipoprotein [Burkholderia sp. AU16741]
MMRSIRWAAATAMAVALLSGCGMWQSTKEATAGMTRAIFITKVKQMNLVIDSRAALNENEQGQSLPVVMRVYQLKDAKVFENAAYVSLLDDDSALLRADLLDSMETTLAPGAAVTLSAPMAADAQAVGVAAFFRDQRGAEWQRVIPKSKWKETDPVKLVVTGNRLELAP